MTFNELIDLRPNVTLADFIQLWLLGYDDKIYINVKVGEVELEHVRIIDSVLVQYYDYKIHHLEDIGLDESGVLWVILEENDE